MITDVLIIGGGIAGLTAAVIIKEKNPDIEVLIVEKQTTG
ncbi:FAD-binding protein [Clostridium tagluense]|nr:FAD-binding protein [Clostridium tagluense]